MPREYIPLLDGAEILLPGDCCKPLVVPQLQVPELAGLKTGKERNWHTSEDFGPRARRERRRPK